MVMFLTLLCISLLGVVVMSAIVYGASPRDQARPETRPGVEPIVVAPGFFGSDVDVTAPRPQLPVDAVIAQLERHVRLEQAAAESFLESATPTALHARTASRFVN